MFQPITAALSKRWLSLKLTQKFGVIFIMLVLIGVVETGISLVALRIVKDTASAAQTSLDVQRMTLEMRRDWEVMKNYQYRFFTLYQEIGFEDAKELYAIPAGKTLSDIIRVGASLNRMTLEPGASENIRRHDVLLQQYLSGVSAYALILDSAVQLASDANGQNELQIEGKLAELETFTKVIEPNFAKLILMAQNEVTSAQGQIVKTQQVVSTFLTLANLLGFALIGLIIYVLNKNISADVARLTNATARMQNGHLKERVMINSTDELGQIGAAFNSMARSIQERTEALSESEARYRELVSAAPSLVFVVQEDKIVYANPACINSLNYALEDLIGMDMAAFVVAEDHALYENWTRKLLQGDPGQSVEIRVVDRGGQTLFLEIVAATIAFNHSKAIMGIGQDITQRRKMEKAMIETEKLAGIGTLAAGIAHEINTPLQVITGYAGSIRRDIEMGDLLQGDQLDNKVASIERNAWRIAAIVQSLLAYARPSADRAGSHLLNDIVEETLLLIEHQLNSWSSISIEKELTADMPLLKCDSNRITQVLINLLTNAADAMPDGGWIVIRTGFDEKSRRFNLQVSDTGPGIPEHLQSRIFEPFFTTKDVGEGTGLGLSIARSIVNAHGGDISLQSQPGKGTIFTISLSQEPVEMARSDLDQVEEGRYDG